MFQRAPMQGSELEPINEAAAHECKMTRHASLMLDGEQRLMRNKHNQQHTICNGDSLGSASRRFSLVARLRAKMSGTTAPTTKYWVSREDLTTDAYGANGYVASLCDYDEDDDNLRHSIREKSTTWMRNKMQQRRMRNRLMQKSGYCNIQLVNVPKQGLKFFNDIFTTIVEMKWRWCLAMFSLSYIMSWLVFAFVFYMCALAHGDFEHHDQADQWTPCISNVNGFFGVLMFSVESQSTIGYGFRYPTEACTPVVLTVCLQNIMGVMIQTLMAGVVFTKIARPKKRAETILFSKQAVVCMRDGQLVLLVRLGDMRHSQLAEAHVRLQMIKKNVTKEGELQPFHQYDMDVGYDTGMDRVFVIWPITICHVIDEDSPFYDISKDDLVSGTARFEIIAILEGVVESTGSTTQARTSYLPSEILWGHRFQKLVTYQRDNGDYRIDFGLFHCTYPTQTPEFSARQMDEMREQGLDPENYYSSSAKNNFLGNGLIPSTFAGSNELDSRETIADYELEQERCAMGAASIKVGSDDELSDVERQVGQSSSLPRARHPQQQQQQQQQKPSIRPVLVATRSRSHSQSPAPPLQPIIAINDDVLHDDDSDEVLDMIGNNFGFVPTFTVREPTPDRQDRLSEHDGSCEPAAGPRVKGSLNRQRSTDSVTGLARSSKRALHAHDGM